MCCVDRELATCVCDLNQVFCAIQVAQSNKVLTGRANPGPLHSCRLNCLVCNMTNHLEKDCRHRCKSCAANGVYHSTGASCPAIPHKTITAVREGVALAATVSQLMVAADRAFAQSSSEPAHCSTCVIDLSLSTCWCKYRALIVTLETALRKDTLA